MDEVDDVSGSVATSVSESAVTITVPRGGETLAEHVRFQGQVEGSFSDGDGGGTMVEAVGSDVFLDGIAGKDFNGKVGVLESGKELEASERGGVVNELVMREVRDSCGEACYGRTETGVDGFEQMAGFSAQEANTVVAKVVEMTAALASGLTQDDVTEITVVKVSEEGRSGELFERVEQKTIDSVGRVSNDSMSQRVDLFDDGGCNPAIKAISSYSEMEKGVGYGLETLTGTEEVIVFVEGKDLSCEGGGMGSDDVKTCLPSSIQQSSDIKTRTEKNSVGLENAEFPDQRGDVTIGGEVEVIDKGNVLSSQVENTESNVKMSLHSSIEQSSNCETWTDENSDGLENAEFVVKQADVTIEREVEVIDKDNILNSQVENTESDVSDQRLPCSIDNQRIMIESSTECIVNDGIFIAEMDAKGILPEPKVPSTIGSDGIGTCSAGFHDMINVNDGNHGSLHSGGESICEESCIAKRRELAVVSVNKAPDFKNGTTEIAFVDTFNDSQKDQDTSSLKIDESFQNYVPLGHLELSGEQSQTPHEGDVAEMDKFGGMNEDLKVGGVVICKKNEGESIPTAGETTEKESTADVNAMACEEQTNIEIEVDSAVTKSQGSVEFAACDALNANTFCFVTDENLKVESSCISTEGDYVGDENPFLGAVVCDNSSSIPPESSNNLGEYTLFQNKKKEAAEALSHEVGQDKSEYGLIVDGMPNNVFKEVLDVTESQLATVTCEPSHSDWEPSSSTSAFTNHFLNGQKNSEVYVASNDTSLPLEDGNGSTDTLVGDPVTVFPTVVVDQGNAAKSGSYGADDTLISHNHVTGETIPNVEEEIEVDKHYTNHLQVDLNGVHDLGIEEYTDSDPSYGTNQKMLKHGSSGRILQSSYLLLPENEGEFSVSDLVWGKVRSHPWWPGQIFDPADASEKAIKYLKKDSFLVAYFGDRTFSWNDASLLKPFHSHFSLVKRQSNSEAFQNAVNCALEEVSRRVELGLACSCLPGDEYEKVDSQIVENTGIREESSRRYGVDKSTGVNSFQPDKLVEYIRELAQFPSGGSERLEFVIAKAQLLAFCRFKGYRQPPIFQFCGGLAENDATSELNEAAELLNDGKNILSSEGMPGFENDSSHKRKHNLNDSMCPRKKERRLTKWMGDMPYSLDGEDGSRMKIVNKLVLSSSGKKRKAVDSVTDGSDKRKSIAAAKVSATVSTIPKPFFKVGECIRRVASQLTASPSLMKRNTD